MKSRKYIFGIDQETIEEIVEEKLYQYQPTVEMAAEILGVSSVLIEFYLELKGAKVYTGGHLSSQAIDALAEKHVELSRNFVKYCIGAYSSLSDLEFKRYRAFVSRYKKPFRTVKSWNDINEARVAKDFKDQLYSMVYDEGPGVFEVPVLEEIEAREYRYCYPLSNDREHIFQLLRDDLYYHARHPERLIRRPLGAIAFTIVFILAHRFHIFSSGPNSEDSPEPSICI